MWSSHFYFLEVTVTAILAFVSGFALTGVVMAAGDKLVTNADYVLA